MDTKNKRTVTAIARGASYIALAWVTLNLVILVVGFFLKLFGANVDAGFTQFVYRSLDRVMEPFRGIFPSAEVGETSQQVVAVLDTSILFAMVFYMIVYLLIRSLVDWLNLRTYRLDVQLREEMA